MSINVKRLLNQYKIQYRRMIKFYKMLDVSSSVR